VIPRRSAPAHQKRSAKILPSIRPTAIDADTAMTAATARVVKTVVPKRTTGRTWA
jgi:hypothetical protein